MTTTVSIHKINNTFSSVTSEDLGALKNLRDHFTFKIPNAHFNPKVKQGIWDGKIRLLKPNGRIYGGLKDELARVCEDYGWSLNAPDYVENDFPTKDDIREFCQGLNLTSGGQPIEIRDHQLDHIGAALRDSRRLLICPTSAGKSLIAYVIIRWVLQNGLTKGLIIVPSINLVSQMATDFADYGWNIHDHIHMIYEGREKNSDKPLTISTWQGIQNEEEWLHQFDFVIGDEAHGYKAKSLVGIMENLINSELRIGMSGTLDGSLTHQMVLEGLFGPIFKTISTADLIALGFSSELEIKAIVLTHSAEVRQTVSAMMLDYDKETEFLMQSKKRNEFIARWILGLKGNTLLYYRFVEKHGEVLYETIKSLNTNPNRKIYYIHGKVKVEERERIRAEIESTTDTIMVVSYGTTSTGANFKSVDNIVFGSAYKGIIKNLQTIGRGLRKVKGRKELCTLYDIADNLSWTIGKKVRDNYTLKHFKERLGIYTKEGFRFKVYEVDLN